ncbi:LamG-like jellyroll fold domain-containing protein [Tichowtungia aerotolerans]|uniref:Uncharacterized protein n=1 Tax=Tichowtungia aerotolerans TaxID=2697043 RepID=A0A6P1M715_9BACT|nr:LamG-like jellyroll fold domain-containing protein [Tichowtungia aerotolerans]QHI68374.1 hypothetical protein GT409_02515 [Tichowtungia aerotolerans]
MRKYIILLIATLIAASGYTELSSYLDSVGSPSDGGAGPALWYKIARSPNDGSAGASYTLTSSGTMTSLIADYWGNTDSAFGLIDNSNPAGVAGSSGLFCSGTNGTVSFLVKTPDTLSGFKSVFNQGVYSDSTQFELGLNGDTFRLGIQNGDTKSNVNLITAATGTWYYVCLRWDLSAGSDNLTWYCGEAGQSLSSGTVTITTAGSVSNPIYFGGRKNTSYYSLIGGYFQSIAVYERTLSDSAVQNQFAKLASSSILRLAAYEATVETPTDEGGGPVLYYSNAGTADSNGHMFSTGSDNAVIYNMGDLTGTGAFGNPDYAVEGRINMGISGSSTSENLINHLAGDNGTVSLLFKTPTTMSGYQSLFNRGIYAQSQALEIGISDGKLRFINNSTKITDVGLLTADTWYYVALSFDLTKTSDDLTWFYGEFGSVTLNSGSITIDNSARPSTTIYIGGRTGSAGFGGLIQEVATWDRTLSEQAITDQFNQTLDAIPYPAVDGPESLIVNGDFTQSANETVPDLSSYRVTGSNGDYPGNDGNYADVVGWIHYNADPNALASYTDLGEVLDGTDKLSTTFKPTLGRIYLSSSMDYRNGMIQTNIFNGVSINPNLDYELSVDVAQVSSKDHSQTTFTATLTTGSGSAATNIANAVPGALIQVSPTTGMPTALLDTPYTVTVSGSDLVAAQSGGPVNVLFESLNAEDIANFPEGPIDPLNADEMSQVFVGTVSLTAILPAGDGNKDGVVGRDDLLSAQLYLATAADRQSQLYDLGYTAAEALAYLNLEMYDMDADNDFDADDLAAMIAIAAPFNIQLSGNGTTFDIEWASLPGKVYDLESSASLSPAAWTPYADYTNIAADVSGTNSVTDLPASELSRFFKVIEKD